MTLIKSMTGYGRAVETVNGREFTVELRSVNNRYLDCNVKLPRMLSFAEEAVKQAVKATIVLVKGTTPTEELKREIRILQGKLSDAVFHGEPTLEILIRREVLYLIAEERGLL